MATKLLKISCVIAITYSSCYHDILARTLPEDSSMLRKVLVFNAGLQRYEIGLKIQSYLTSMVKNSTGKITGYLCIIEHPPVYTVGVRGKVYGPEMEEQLKKLGAEFYRTTRGGLITFHGPGQLVVYPILNLAHFKANSRWYVETLEKVMIDVCKHYDLTAYTTPNTGVWVNDKKICAMGIRISQLVTSHGVGLNCNTNMSWFDEIVPCGLVGKKATSLSAECGRDIIISEVVPNVLLEFGKHFQCEFEECSKEFYEEVFNEIESEEKSRNP